MSKAFEFRRFGGALGGEILGLNLSQPLAESTVDELRATLSESGGLLVFRCQQITPAQHVAFSQRFGPLMVHVLRQYLLPGYPEILRVSNVIENGQPIGLGDAGAIWHSDLSYTPEPSLGSLLLALELPSEGGDTSFANMRAAYEALPADMKRQIHRMKAVHSYSHSYDKFGGSRFRPPLSKHQLEEVPEVIHPVVRTHPETRGQSIFVNEGFTSRIVGLPDTTSRDLLQYLFSHCTHPRFIYRHKWQNNDLVFWDNRCTIHIAHGCPPELRRHMHRTTVRGDAPYFDG